MTEKFHNVFANARDALALESLIDRHGYSREGIDAGNKKLRDQVVTSRAEISKIALSSATVVYEKLPTSGFSLPIAVIGETTDPERGRVQIATIARFHPRVAVKQETPGQENTVTRSPKERFNSLSVLAVPERGAHSSGFVPLRRTTYGLSIGEARLQPRKPLSEFNTTELYSELLRLDGEGGVRDLVEGTYITLRLNHRSANNIPLLSNYDSEE